MSPQAEVKPFLLLFSGPCLVVWIKSLAQVPRITLSMHNTLNRMHWLNAKIWLTYVKVSPPYKCDQSGPWLAPWTLMCSTPSSQATRLCIIVNLTSLLLRHSKGGRDGIRMYVPYMTHGKFGTLLLPILFFPQSIYWMAWHAHIISSPTEVTAHLLRTA